jgi:O-antigen/teichoic acid export membrane protein
MIRSILLTTGTRIITAIAALVILGLNSKFLGIETLGSISLLVIGITLNMMIAHIFCGAVMVFFASRRPVIQLFLIGITWSLLSSAFGTFIQHLIGAIPTEWIRDTFLLSFLISTGSMFQNLLLGSDRLKQFNFSLLLQQLTLLGVLIYMIFFSNERSIYAFTSAYYSSWLITLFYLLIIIDEKKKSRQKSVPIQQLLAEMWRFGIIVQLTNFVQALNYRIIFYFIDWYYGRQILGFFAAGNQLAEGIWIIGKSLATVVYSKLSVITDEAYAKNISIRITKFCLALSLAGATILLLIPQALYVAWLGEDFREIHSVLTGLIPGILFLSGAMIFAHYFASRALYKINLIASIAGFISLVAGAYFLLPLHPIFGPALAVSFAYFVNFIVTTSGFMRITKTSFGELMPSGKDFREALQILKK